MTFPWRLFNECPTCKRGVDQTVTSKQIGKELEGQSIWLADLYDTIHGGDTQTALDTIQAAIRMLEK